MTGKSAFITGGNRGIGLETARQLGKLGYIVIIGARNADQAKAACDTLKGEGINCHHVTIDVQDEKSVAAAAEVVSKITGGSLDALINNAGYNAGRGTIEVDVEALATTFDINVCGVVRVTNHFLPLVRKSPAGRIVNVGSIMASLTLNIVTVETATYNISKTALNMYTVNLAKALADTNIKVNVGHPGWVKTDMGGPNADLTIEEGAETNIYLATLPADGPTGGYFYKKETLPW